MLDIRFIRENPVEFDAALARRDLPEMAGKILALDKDRREYQAQMQNLQSERNDLSKKMGAIMASGNETGSEIGDLMAQVATIKGNISIYEVAEANLVAEMNKLLLPLPNILDESVPDGKTEEDNKPIREWGVKPKFDFTPKDHVEIGEGLGQMDFKAGVKLSGARFVVLRHQLAKLERALAAFMLDMHTSEFGYTEILPPVMVLTKTMEGTGQLPKFADDLFPAGDHWLIPTAEVPLTNLVADTILDAKELPLRMTAYTPCFRAEAGAAGRDTSGLIRLHQFSKVELVSVVAPDKSTEELERMTGIAEAVLQRLGIAYRVVKLCSGDTGFSAKITYDIEVWLAGQNDGKGQYREISSCSNCGDFQARRMKARMRTGEKETQFVHTLNGSALAIGRCMIAILENGQQADGSVMLPDVLHSYMGTDRLVAE